ncbi:MAG: alginate export family protein [Gammaproteobacteria bacterium]|nr:alginate export family protein [Gammaproteobacteria bacterium]
MDLFSLQNLHNLEFSYTKRLRRSAQVNASWNAFWLAEEDTDAWYNAGLAPIRTATMDVDAYVGNELDITVSAPFFSGRISLLAGASIFLAGPYLKDFGLAEDAHFFYVGATYTIH